MGTGWRRAFFTTVPGERETEKNEKQQTNIQKFMSKSLRCRSTSYGGAGESSEGNETPKELFRSKTTTPKSSKSNSASPRSPLKLSFFRNSFKFLRRKCGICLNSVKTGNGTATYTGECSHQFHFSCITEHVRNRNSLVCPVCNTTWNDVPLLAAHTNLDDGKCLNAAVLAESAPKLKTKDKKVVEYSSPGLATGGSEPQSKPSTSTSYGDDEPLLMSRFVPIPEEDENEEDEDKNENANRNDVVGDVKGSVVNSSPSFPGKNDEISSNVHYFKNVQVRIMPDSAVVSVGREYETYAVALTVKAPARGNNKASPLLDPSQRAPIDLVTVLDVSTSMDDAKLQMLKRAMRLVISSLDSSDRLSIVIFSSRPKRLLRLRRMTAQGRRAARSVVKRLVCNQGSNAGDALRKASKVLEDRREKNPVASIILLADGQDDKNQTTYQREGVRHVSAARFEHIQIPVHAAAFGESDGSSQEPVEDTFTKCIRRLMSVMVLDLRIQLGAAFGSSPYEISAVYLCGENPTVINSGSVRLGNMYAAEEREILVELRVPAAATVGSRHVLSVRYLYRDSLTQELVYSRDQPLLVPRPHAIGSSAAKIGRLRDRFVATQAVAESRRLAENGELIGAHHLLMSAQAMMTQSDGGDDARKVKAELAEIQWRWQQLMENQKDKKMIKRLRRSQREMMMVDNNGEASAWRAAEKLAKVAVTKRSLSEVSDLHGFGNATF